MWQQIITLGLTQIWIAAVVYPRTNKKTFSGLPTDWLLQSTGRLFITFFITIEHISRPKLWTVLYLAIYSRHVTREAS